MQVYSSFSFLLIISSFSSAVKAISNLSLSDFFVIFNDLHNFLYSNPSVWLRLSIIEEDVNMVKMEIINLLKCLYYIITPFIQG